MAVHHPGSRAGSGVALKAIRETIVHGSGKGIFASLNVVPMIDLFTMLVIFLIQQYSASGELSMMNPNVAMPKAGSQAQLARAPMIALTHGSDQNAGQMLLDNKPIISLSEINEAKFPSWDIDPLSRALDCTKNGSKGDPGCVGKSLWALEVASAVKRPPGKDGQGNKPSRKIIIQADRGVPFKVIKMVMATCGRHEFREPNFAIMVDSRGDDGNGKDK